MTTQSDVPFGPAGREAKRWRDRLDLATTVMAFLAALGILGSLVTARAMSATRHPPVLRVPTEPQSLDKAARLGSSSAVVVLIEYSDFQCPFCAAFASTELPDLKAKYVDTGHLLVIFRHNPLPIHRDAAAAAQAAVCAGEQGRFWQAHDLLFKNQTHLSDELPSLSASLGLSEDQYRRCTDSPQTDEVTSDLASAKRLGISGTPTFLLGTRLPDGRARITQTMRGARKLADFERAIEGVLGQRHLS